MPKLKGPLFSLSAQGPLAKLLTFRRHGPDTVVGIPTTHPDAGSPAQLSWRTMYEACSSLWHTLSDVEKQAWESNARAKHMTGYALWQSQCLRPNPGIYLPLAGGTMQGDINTDGHKVTGLPLPTLDPDAATKAYVDAAGAGFDPFAQLLLYTAWPSLDGSSYGGSGAYVIQPQFPYLYLRTDNTSGDFAQLTSTPEWRNIVEAAKLLTVQFIITWLNYIDTQHLWLRLSRSDLTPPDPTRKHFGWELIDARLYASNADGVNQTITDTLIDLIDDWQTTRLRLDFLPGSYIKYYVNATLVATHTTNLPSPEPFYLNIFLVTNSNNTREIRLGPLLIQKQY